MRIHTDSGSRTERIASIAVATGVTVASALIVLASARPSLVPAWAPVATNDPKQHSERLAYVVTAPTTTIASERPAVPPSSRAESRHAVASPARERESKPDSDVASAAGAGVPQLTTPIKPTVADAGAPWPAPAVSPLLWSDDSALRAGHGNLAGTLAAGLRDNPSLTQTDLDAHLRAEALAAIAARGAGLPITRTASGGGHVDIPLPFSGPSRKQRERERAINAQTMKSLAHVLQRLDSVAASRKRRQADSLAHVEDSLHRDSRSQN